VGTITGVLAALGFWLLNGTSLGCLVLFIEFGLAFGAGWIAALMAQPAALALAAAVPAAPGSVGGAPPEAGWTTPGEAAPPAGSLAPPPPAPAAKPPSVRARQVRAAAIAGALGGIGWGLAGMAAIAGQATSATLASQINAQMEQNGLPAGSGDSVIGVVLICTGCVVLLIFPALCAGLGALGGYILTAVRPAARG
jgi:hypothetical protein